MSIKTKVFITNNKKVIISDYVLEEKNYSVVVNTTILSWK
jgi:hypothetical protein